MRPGNFMLIMLCVLFCSGVLLGFMICAMEGK